MKVYNNHMKNKYERLGLIEEEIAKGLLELNLNTMQEYDEAVLFFLNDTHFEEIGDFLDVGDFAMAKDATKGLFYLAGDLMLLPLYEKILEVLADLNDEDYSEVIKHYEAMLESRNAFIKEFSCTELS